MFFQLSSLHLLMGMYHFRRHLEKYPSLPTFGWISLAIHCWPSRFIGLEEMRKPDPPSCILHFWHFTVGVEVIMVNTLHELFYPFWTELVSWWRWVDCCLFTFCANAFLGGSLDTRQCFSQWYLPGRIWKTGLDYMGSQLGSWKQSHYVFPACDKHLLYSCHWRIHWAQAGGCWVWSISPSQRSRPSDIWQGCCLGPHCAVPCYHLCNMCLGSMSGSLHHYHYRWQCEGMVCITYQPPSDHQGSWTSASAWCQDPLGFYIFYDSPVLWNAPGM